MGKSDEIRPNSRLHVGLIGDGIRRWAILNNIKLRDAYIVAMNNVAIFVDFFFNNSSDILSLYMLSKDNLNRPKEDLQAAIDGETFFLKTVLYDLVKKWDCSVYLAGNTELLPEEYLESICQLTKLSSSNSRKIYLLAGYSPIDEIKQAIRRSGINFQNSLWVQEPVDIVIRTSGEYRISNFLPLQIGYAELFFLKKHINDLNVDDYRVVLENYHKRNRRFGK